ncbi:MAG TPA: TadE/TadG family type IV pilus assembly protein [Dehalococcoidia bacterium]|nr:TadE/TadG family type IV pilus assembly protein [Dehalococcoidia bacterium]
MVEFALILPFILTLLLGVVELGNGLNSYVTIVDAARDGARLGSRGSTVTAADITAAVNRDVERLSGAGPTVTVTNPTVGGLTAVKVKVCYNHPLIIGLPGVLPNPLPMCSESTMPQLPS